MNASPALLAFLAKYRKSINTYSYDQFREDLIALVDGVRTVSPQCEPAAAKMLKEFMIGTNVIPVPSDKTVAG